MVEMVTVTTTSEGGVIFRVKATARKITMAAATNTNNDAPNALITFL